MQSVLGTSALNETRLAYVSILTNQNFFDMRLYDKSNISNNALI